MLLVLVVAATWLFVRGIGIWGIDIPVAWGLAIAEYVWWIALASGGTIVSALFLSDPLAVALGDQPDRRIDDAVRGGLRRHLADPASRPAWFFLLAVPLSRT